MSTGEELEFGDYGHEAAVSGVRRPDAATYEFEHSGAIGDDKAALLGGEEEAGERTGGPAWWSFAFYQRYFDVDTDQVLGRLLAAAIPRPHNFIRRQLRPLPDLYGPVWVSTTLVFAMAICGNIAAYLGSAGSDKDLHWAYDFGLVTASATTIAAYVLLVPAALVTWSWWRKLEEPYGYLELVCAYGYSLGPLVPAALLNTLPLEWLRWAAILIAVAVSGVALAGSLWPLLRGDTNKAVALAALVGLLALHGLLGLGCKQYFFASGQAVEVVSTPVATQAPVLPESLSTAAVAAAAANGSSGAPVEEGKDGAESAGTEKGTETVKKTRDIQMSSEPRPMRSLHLASTAS